MSATDLLAKGAAIAEESVQGGGLPPGWKRTVLGEVVASMKNGIYKSRDAYCDDGIACLRMYNIEGGKIVWKDIKRMRLSQDEVREYGLLPGDLLVNRVNSRELVGKTAAIRPGLEECVFESKNIRVRLKTNLADPRFVSFALQANGQSHFTRNAQQVVGMASISQPQVAAFPLPLPPLDEQQRIVAEIEKQFTRLEAGVASLKRVQAALKRYRASVLKAACEGRLVPTEAERARRESRSYESAPNLLARILDERRESWNRGGTYKEPAAPSGRLTKLPEGWAWCMSGALFSFITSGSRGWAEYYSPTGALFLRIGNLDHENIRLDLRDLQHVTPPAGAEGVRTSVQARDILISITADVGMVALVPDGLGEAYINQHVALARPLPSLTPDYLAYYLCASEGGWGCFKKLQRGATKVGLGLDDIRSVPVPLPPLAEQQRIVAEVERRLSITEELETVVAANLQRAIRLRQSILQQAFKSNL